MKVLVIDNNVDPRCWGSSDITAFARYFPGSEWSVRRGPHDDIPRSASGFDRVILSGSLTAATAEAPWISNLETFIRRCIDGGVPLLGICYGHQMIGRVVGGMDHVRRAERDEFGWSRIEVLEPSMLFDGLGDSFHSFSSHCDEVSRAPKGLKVTARSEICPIQAFEMTDRPVFGIQFHPEKTLEEGRVTFNERKKKGKAKEFLNHLKAAKLFSPKVGETIFRNFLALKTT